MVITFLIICYLIILFIFFGALNELWTGYDECFLVFISSLFWPITILILTGKRIALANKDNWQEWL